jgi:hypothetical protein
VLALCAEAEPLQARIRYPSPLIQVDRALSLLSLGHAETGLKLLREVAAVQYQNTVTQQRVQLGYITGLSMTGDYQQCYDRAAALVETARNQNIILYGRGLLWQGMAMNALNKPDAMEVLNAALDVELKYGGRDAWLAYYALGTASPDRSHQCYWYNEAVSVLQATANSLHNRPDLQRSLLNQPMVRWLVEMSK